METPKKTRYSYNTYVTMTNKNLFCVPACEAKNMGGKKRTNKIERCGLCHRDRSAG